MSTETEVYDVLKLLAGGRVYPVRIEQSAEMPAVAFQRVSAPRETTLDRSVTLANPQIGIAVFDVDREGSRIVAEQVIAAMRASSILGDLIDDAESFDPETQLFSVLLTYSCWEIG